MALSSEERARVRALRLAVLEYLRRTRRRAGLATLEDSLERKDARQVLRILGISEDQERIKPPEFTALLREVRRTYQSAAIAASGRLKATAGMNFNMRNPRVVDFLDRYTFDLIRGTNRVTREAIRGIMTRMWTEGIPPKIAARTVREVVGLTPNMQRYVVNFRQQLATQQIGSSTTPWMRRLDAATRQQVKAAMRAARPLTSAQIDELVERYSRSLLNRRAENIARTETVRAANAGRHATWEQAIQEGLLDGEKVRRFWSYTPDDRVRETHVDVARLNPDGVAFDEDFKTPDGPLRMPPYGVNCRCTVTIQEVR